ncbi:MAG: DUF4013 domain-containing protein [Deltaproteobacteria bacterium]|nr:MAG: DUF4013 domain-containing protein [Deltaproteobacteria bacterium]
MDAPAQVDVGTALSGLTSDPDWLKKYALVGLFMLIPVVGPIAAMGWQRRVFEAARRGDTDTLPDLEFGEDIGRGVPVFVAMLNLALPIIVVGAIMAVLGIFVAILSGGIESATDNSGVGGLLGAVVMLGGYALMFVIIIAVSLFAPEIQRRGFRGEMAPLLSPGPSIAAIKNNLGAYGMVLVGLIVANFVSGLGAFACYVGVFFTMPIALVILARLIAQWDRVVEAQQGG